MKKTISTVACIALLFLTGSEALAASHDGDHGEGPTDQTFKVGKTGEVNIGRDVKVASNLVKRGKYLLAHRTESQSRVFVLTEVNKKKQPSELIVYELNSRLVAHPDRVKNSTLLAKEQKKDEACLKGPKQRWQRSQSLSHLLRCLVG